MGIALADAASDYGAEVELVLGPVDRIPKNGEIKIIHVKSASAMAEECIERFPSCDIAILAAAVADYSPDFVEKSKIKRAGDQFILKLKPTKDIAATLGKSKKRSQIIAGFALETNNELENAKVKLIQKKLDLIVLNSLSDEGAGFGSDTNKITIIDRNNIIGKFELKSKEEAARDILDKIISMLKT